MGVGRNLAYKKKHFLLNKSLTKAEIVSGDDDLVVNEISNSENTFVSLTKNSLTLTYPTSKWKTFIKQKKGIIQHQINIS